jgi:hypothetical protein
MAVTIPVMAKAQIGHFVEVQVLEVLGGGKARGPGRNGPTGAQLGRDQGLTSPTSTVLDNPLSAEQPGA